MTGPRKKKESATDFIPTPDRQSEIPSGFCMTGHHDNCKYVFIFGKCGCECHTQTPKTQIVREEIETEEDLIIIEDPRPWRNK